MQQPFALILFVNSAQETSYFLNIGTEGTVSQNFYLGLTFCFMSKKGNFLYFFAIYYSRLHKIKTKA